MILFAAAICAAVNAVADESAALLSSSAYRLSLASREAFRLSAREPYAPAPVNEPATICRSRIPTPTGHSRS